MTAIADKLTREQRMALRKLHFELLKAEQEKKS